VIVQPHKGLHQNADLDGLVCVRPGRLDRQLELVGIEHVRRAIYKAGSSLRIRYDERLMADIQNVVGSGNVRLLGQRRATAQIDCIAPPPVLSQPSPVSVQVLEADESAVDEMGDD
jgi:DNA polymerase-3 subunit alpha